MTNSNKFLVTTASSEIFILRRGLQKAIRGFCEICEAETEMLDLNLAVNVFPLGMREIIGQIETGAIHSTETTSGHLLVCQDSLQNFVDKLRRQKK